MTLSDAHTALARASASAAAACFGIEGGPEARHRSGAGGSPGGAPSAASIASVARAHRAHAFAGVGSGT